MSGESKKEEFRKYLERSGVIDALTKVLVALYEEPEKPANALDFIKQYLGAPTSGDVETMKAEKDELVKKNEELTKQLEVSSTPVPSCTAQQIAIDNRTMLAPNGTAVYATTDASSIFLHGGFDAPCYIWSSKTCPNPVGFVPCRSPHFPQRSAN